MEINIERSPQRERCLTARPQLHRTYFTPNWNIYISSDVIEVFVENSSSISIVSNNVIIVNN